MDKLNLSTRSLFAFGIIAASSILVANTANAAPDFIQNSRNSSQLISQTSTNQIISQPIVVSPTKKRESFKITTQGDEQKSITVKCPKKAKKCDIKIEVHVEN